MFYVFLVEVIFTVVNLVIGMSINGFMAVNIDFNVTIARQVWGMISQGNKEKKITKLLQKSY